MTYLEFISKNITDLKGFNSLYKVYAPQDQKNRGDDLIKHIVNMLENHMRMVSLDDRPDPF